MIFDPALAAAARRHQRAKTKAEKSSVSGDSPNTSAESSVNNKNSSSTSKRISTATTPSAAAAKAPRANVDGTQAVGASPETSEHNGSGVVKALGVGEKAESSSGSVGDVVIGTVSGAGTLSRTASASSNGLDFDGVTARVRAAGGASRQRPMKPRVLLKIVVLGCSNVSCLCAFFPAPAASSSKLQGRRVFALKQADLYKHCSDVDFLLLY